MKGWGVPWDVLDDSNSNSYYFLLIRWNSLLQLSACFIMSPKRFGVNLHAIIAWMSSNALFETGEASEVQVTATGFEWDS